MTSLQTPRKELRIAGITAQHIGDRSEQQDRVAVMASERSSRCVLGILADGMGGRTGGALAAENVVLCSQRRFNEFAPDAESVEEFFGSLVYEVHTVLRLTSMTAGLQPHSTFAAVMVQPDRVDWCHVGDSRIYCVRDHQLEHCTEDHTYARQLIEQGKLPPERARMHPSANHLTNALGSDRPPKPTIGGMSGPRAGNAFLLCSDGLWNYFAESEIVNVIERNPVREAAEILIGAARDRARGRGDNCSLVLFKFSEAEKPAQRPTTQAQPGLAAASSAAAAPVSPDAVSADPRVA